MEEIRAITEEAARAERIVATHAYTPTGILNALRGGVKTIEHGNMLNETVIEYMLEHKETVTWDPTACLFSQHLIYVRVSRPRDRSIDRSIDRSAG